MLRSIGRLLVVLAFGWAGCAAAGPITDTINVDGAEWAQVDLFLGLSWSDINAVCPAGECGSGSLNGFDMAGWSWATIADVNNLFNHYIGFTALGPGPGRYFGDQYSFTAPFFADGWRPGFIAMGFSPTTAGRIADDEFIQPFLSEVNAPTFVYNDQAWTDSPVTFLTGDSGIGSWFVRSAPIPAPATLPLFGLALITLGLSRKLLSGIA